MRKDTGALGVIAVIVLVAVASSGSLVAEVSVGSAGVQQGLLMSGSGGLDPYPYPWAWIRENVPGVQVLNPDGDANGDGPASFAIDPADGAPVVAWAWFDGEDHEIVLSRWTGSGWSAPEPLTDNAVDDLDPDLSFGEDGALHVTWWRDGATPAVLARHRTPGGSWGPEEPVTGADEPGRLPGVAADPAAPRVGWQGTDGPDTTVVVSSRRDDGTWRAELVARTGYAGPAGDGDVDVRVHALAGRLWVDWVDGPGELAFSVRDPATGTWSAPESEPYDWDESAGECEFHARELARQRVRWRVLGR